jgi:hypothetical protein
MYFDPETANFWVLPSDINDPRYLDQFGRTTAWQRLMFHHLDGWQSYADYAGQWHYLYQGCMREWKKDLFPPNYRYINPNTNVSGPLNGPLPIICALVAMSDPWLTHARMVQTFGHFQLGDWIAHNFNQPHQRDQCRGVVVSIFEDVYPTSNPQSLYSLETGQFGPMIN